MRQILRIVAVVLFLAAVAPAGALAAQQAIDNKDELNAATTLNGSDRTFNQGIYVIGADTPSIYGDQGINYILGGNSQMSVSGGNKLENPERGGLVADMFTVNDNASLTAGGGGMGVGGDGLSAVSGVRQNGGNILASGGGGESANGINVESGTQQNPGFGFEQNGGLFIAVGGSGENSQGMKADDILTQNGGEIRAIGGSGGVAFGIGLFDGSLRQAGGSIMAQGGSGMASHGILMDGTAGIGGNLTVRAGSGQNAYSMFVNNAVFDNQGDISHDFAEVGLTFGSGSLLTVDINGSDNGNILLRSGNVQIDSGARLAVSGLNTITTGGSKKYEFLSIYEGSGQILGEFLTPDSQTLGFTAEKSADGQSYSVTVARVAELADVVRPGSNAGSAVAMLENAASASPEFNAVLDQLDMISGTDGFDRIVGNSFSPQQNVQALQGMRSLSSGLSASAMQSINVFSQSLASTSSMANAAGYASIDPAGARGNGSTLWATPFFSAGEQRAKTNGFSDMDEQFYGASIGYAKTVDQNDFGVALNYIRGDYDSSGYRSDSDLYGFTLVGRHRFVGTGCFAPELSVWGGYGFVEQEQRRRTFGQGWAESDPNVNQFYAGASLANRFQISSVFHITPSVGLNYAYQRQNGYRERGGGILALDVDSAGHSSLLGTLGVEFGFALGCRAGMTVSGAYEYEMADTQATVRSGFVGMPSTAREYAGQKLSRHQGRIGTEFKYQITDRAALSAGYDLRLGDRYINHKVNVGFAFDF